MYKKKLWHEDGSHWPTAHLSTMANTALPEGGNCKFDKKKRKRNKKKHDYRADKLGFLSLFNIIESGVKCN